MLTPQPPSGPSGGHPADLSRDHSKPGRTQRPLGRAEEERAEG